MFYYPTWYERGIKTIQDLIYDGTRFKEFFELVLEFDIPIGDKRKYLSITKAIPIYTCRLWSKDNRDPFEFLKEKLLVTKHFSKFSYSIFKESVFPQKRSDKWNDIFNIEKDNEDWSLVHKVNFKCTIETQLRSFYFKSFHGAIATNDFLYKIKRSDTELCNLCERLPDSIEHILIYCEVVRPLWTALENYLSLKLKKEVIFSDFERMFGCPKDYQNSICINFFLLCTRFYIHCCKFKKEKPNFHGLISLIKIKSKSEYVIAAKYGKLSLHFKKFIFEL